MQIFIFTRLPDNIRERGFGIKISQLMVLIPNQIIICQPKSIISEIIECEFEKQIIIEIAKNWKYLKRMNIILIELINIHSGSDPLVMGTCIKLLYKIMGMWMTNSWLKSDIVAPFNLYSDTETIVPLKLNFEKLANNLSHKIGYSKQFRDQILLNEIQEFMEE